MSYTDTLKEIDQLKANIEAKGVLSQEVLKRISYKFRLEWNFTSNSMEGNSLTRRETRTVMVGLLAVTDKPIKDVMEMRQHDTVISTILQLGAGELNISERRIKDIHRGIMYEEDPEKLRYVGEWKNVDNYLINFRGERLDFTPHSEVPERIHELVNWLNAEKDKIVRGDNNALHPAMLAFQFHIRYLTIHPFYDGNGRTARILSNLILISFGFPPLYIKENEKEAYYQYLTDIQGYGGAPDLFYNFMSQLLLRSQQIVMNAVEGKELEEPDDYLKELELVKVKLKSEPIVKSPKVVYGTYKSIESALWKPLINSLTAFSELFNESKEQHKVNSELEQFKTERRSLFNPSFTYMHSDAPKPLSIFGYDVYETEINNVSWEQIQYGLKGTDTAVNFYVKMWVGFSHNSYTVSLYATTERGASTGGTEIANFTKQYYVSIDEEEIQQIKADLGKHLVKAIKSYIDTEDQK